MLGWPGANTWRIERRTLQTRAGAVVIGVTLELERDGADGIVKRMRKAWIQRKSKQPLTFQPALRAFRHPRGLNAAVLIEQAGLAGTKVGGAQVSERHPNFILIQAGATARDVLRLLDMIRSRVQDQFNIELEREASVW